MKSDDLLTHFNFENYQGKIPREGYLYSFTSTSDTNGIFYKLLFLSTKGRFYIDLPFYPYVLIESMNNDLLVEVLRREYKSKIYSMKEIQKYDPNVKNHLNVPPKQYLKVFFKTELDFKSEVDLFKKIKRRREIKEKFNIKSCEDGSKKIQKIFEINQNKYYASEENLGNIASLETLIYDVHEYDVPFDITFMVKNNIRCGKYYNIGYVNERYDIQELPIIVPPEIVVLAWDIETWKRPMQFPVPEDDPIMMISGVIGQSGFLIINSELVSKRIMDFEYKVEVDDQIIEVKVYNCVNEEKLLLQFIEKIMEIQPDILTTFNGDSFDVPYVEKRMEIHNLVYYFKSIVHLDCYKWVKRDSYLPMGSQGLKAVTKIKLGYTPDDIDPEDMVNCARTDPDKLAAYSVSDSIATFLLYSKYVHPFIYSLCTLIPLSPVDVLSKGSGTLCESLLIAESWNYMVLIPSKRIENDIYYDGRVCEDVSYVGGHVECLKSGIFRSDFYYSFKMKRERLMEMKRQMEIFSGFSENEKRHFTGEIDKIIDTEEIEEFITINAKPYIYHLDVSAMYPNIILTNRLQPISVINEFNCINCDYYDEKEKCQRKMKWDMKIEYIPTKREEIQTIESQLINMNLNYVNLKNEQKDLILREKIKEYSRAHYKKSTETEIFEMENVVCQREIPFYVDIVKRFRDRRNEFKQMFKDVRKEYDSCQEVHKRSALEKTLVIYESLQIAHKCILNSFYGYAMRRNSRWFSMSMAAIVCHTGAQVIKLAKNFVDDIGITLELDTDGIWCLIPDMFPVTCLIDGKVSNNLLSVFMNFLVESEFTNHQYQEKDLDGNFIIDPLNCIDFEIDGPYKAMILPSSTEEGKQIKKKYVVINKNDQICELKGFELKRRGELKIVKRFQEELFPLFTQGSTLKECYEVVKNHCLYYLVLIDNKGSSLTDNDIFDLFSESKNMAKQFKEYENRKTVSTGTALKLSEFLGMDILDHKGLKCEFVISKYPKGSSITERAIPIKIFQADLKERKTYLRKWLKCDLIEIRDILDWDYYYERLENTILRIVILPSIQQGINDLIPKIRLPQWAIPVKNMNLLDFGLKKIIKDTESNKMEAITNVCEDMKVDPKIDYKKYLKSKEDEWISLRDNLSKINIIQIKDGTVVYIKHKRIQRKIYSQMKAYLCCIENKEFLEEIRNRKEVRIIEEKGNIYLIKEIDNRGSIYLFNSIYIKNIKLYPLTTDQIINYSSKQIQKKINAKDINFTIPIDLIEINILFSFEYDNTTFYMHSNNQGNVVFTDNKQYSNHVKIVVVSFATYMKKINIKNNVFFLNKLDRNNNTLANFFMKNEGIIINTVLKPSRLFVGFNIIVDDYHSQIDGLREEISIYNLYSRYLDIPFSNLFEFSNYEILDHLFAREIKTKDFLLDNFKMKPLKRLKTYGLKKGFYGNHSIEIQVSGLYLSSILHYKEISSLKIPDDLLLIRDLCRNLLNRFHIFEDAIKVKRKVKELLECLNTWISNGRELITEDCKLCFKFLYSQFLNLLINAISEFGADIISFDRDIIILNTGKKTRDSTLSYFNYLSSAIREIELFSHVQISLRKIFDKLVIVDLSTQLFTISDSEPTIYCNNNLNLVKNFINLFFRNEITDQYFYNLLYSKKYKNFDSIRTMLDIYETVTNVDKLRDLCYYALGVNPFEEKNEQNCIIECFCKNCGFENNIHNLNSVCCKGCLETIDQSIIDRQAYKEIQNLIVHHLYRCSKCYIEIKRLSSLACKCGGDFEVYFNMKRIEGFRKYLKNEELNEHLNNYFKNF